jgi:hypothetical protein
MPPPETKDTALEGRLRRLRVIAWVFWPGFFVAQAAANTLTVWMDVARAGLRFERWEVATWEFSSNLVWLALVPLVLAMRRRVPPAWQGWPRRLAMHLLASLAVSALHVLLMVLLRKAVYLAQGGDYDFGTWWLEWPYEALKDVRGYAFIVVLAEGWQLLLWRMQGEASLPEAGPVAPAPPSSTISSTTSAPGGDTAPAPDRFLVKKLGREFLLPTAEIESVQADGNYVLLRCRGHDYPLRSTLAAMEQRLGPDFARVHRSHLVNLQFVRQIDPTPSGDARIHTAAGNEVPCSRNYLESLRTRLS